MHCMHSGMMQLLYRLGTKTKTLNCSGLLIESAYLAVRPIYNQTSHYIPISMYLMSFSMLSGNRNSLLDDLGTYSSGYWRTKDNTPGLVPHFETAKGVQPL